MASVIRTMTDTPEASPSMPSARSMVVTTVLRFAGSLTNGDAHSRASAQSYSTPLLSAVRLTVLIGAYAQAYYLGARRRHSLGATVQAWRDYGPDFLPLPHPSPRNILWMKRRPWFENEVVPEVRRRVHECLGD